MASSPLTAAVPTGPLVDDAGNVTTAWRAFFVSLFERTGNTVGSSTTAAHQSIATETTARTSADTSLSLAISNETANRVAADSLKYDKTGGTISGPVGFYGTTAAGRQTITGSKGGNAALASLLSALNTIGLVTDSST